MERRTRGPWEVVSWMVLVGSGLLIAWQGVAFLRDDIPQHILPLVVALSGTQEATPVAYAWTVKLGLLSVAGFGAAGVSLIGFYMLRRRGTILPGRYFWAGVAVYGVLWAITAVYGVPGVDRAFDQEFANGVDGFGEGGEPAKLSPVVRIPFSQRLRDPRTFPADLPETGWRARSHGWAVAPFVVVDEAACQWGPLAGFSARRVAFWFFGYTSWKAMMTYWQS